jgi:hypothetical protein
VSELEDEMGVDHGKSLSSNFHGPPPVMPGPREPVHMGS